MKRMLRPLVLLLALVLFCAWATRRVELICKETGALLQRAEERSEEQDFSGALEAAEEARRVWNAHEGFLGMALRHTESDDISVLFPPLLEACGQEDGEDFRQRSRELRAALETLWRMEVPYYFNVL